MVAMANVEKVAGESIGLLQLLLTKHLCILGRDCVIVCVYICVKLHMGVCTWLIKGGWQWG
jgi:hypothetical protein